MVNMYGAGNAYNLRYQQRTYMPQVRTARQTVMPQRGGCFGHSCNTTTNIKITNGPTGFWGFMSGLIGGLFGGGGLLGGLFGNLFGGLFGGGNSNMNMNMGYSPFGMLNQAQMQPNTPAAQDKLGNLKTLYPKFNIVSDGNGKYTATDADGKLVGQGLSYEDMCKALSAKQESNGKAETDDGSKSKDVKSDNTTLVHSEGNPENLATEEGNGSRVGSGNDGSRVGNGNGARRSGVNLDGWYRAHGGGAAEGNNGVKFSTCKNASQVTNMLLRNKMDYLSNTDRAELTKEIIAKNPSVFNSDGTVKPGLNWDKLDIPSIDYIKEKYVAEGETITDANGTVSYVSNTTEEISSKRSQINRDQIANKMGYTKTPHRDIYQKGNHYYKYVDGKFTPLTQEETKALNGQTPNKQSYRPTERKGIYYNEQTKKHYTKKGNNFVPLVVTENGKTYNVKQIGSNGTWIDTDGNSHKTVITV